MTARVIQRMICRQIITSCSVVCEDDASWILFDGSETPSGPHLGRVHLLEVLRGVNLRRRNDLKLVFVIPRRRWRGRGRGRGGRCGRGVGRRLGAFFFFFSSSFSSVFVNRLVAAVSTSDGRLLGVGDDRLGDAGPGLISATLTRAVSAVVEDGDLVLQLGTAAREPHTHTPPPPPPPRFDHDKLNAIMIDRSID